jgi:hypothetical protein
MTVKNPIAHHMASKSFANGFSMLLFGFLLLLNSFAFAQCASAPYGAYGSLTPTCNGFYQNATTCGYGGEYPT